MKRESIARVAHEINRAYAASLGDDSQPVWEDAPEWQQSSALAGVDMNLANPDATPEQSHESWLAQKTAEGWAYGEVKDVEKKLHPCFLPYAELPPEQKAKDYLFRGVVHALKDIPDATAAEAKVVDLEAALAKLVNSAAPAVVARIGYVPVKYIGRRPDWQDHLYDTGLHFTEGQTRSVPLGVSKLLLQHRDLFEEGVAEATQAAPESAKDDTDALLENGKKSQKSKEEQQIEFAVIDQVNQMDKDALVEFAMGKYALKLNKTKSLPNLRKEVIDRINLVGAA